MCYKYNPKPIVAKRVFHNEINYFRILLGSLESCHDSHNKLGRLELRRINQKHVLSNGTLAQSSLD